jgi:hypothetical protein
MYPFTREQIHDVLKIRMERGPFVTSSRFCYGVDKTEEIWCRVTGCNFLRELNSQNLARGGIEL